MVRGRLHRASASGESRRLSWFAFIYAVCSGLIITRLFFLQVLDYKKYTAQAAAVRGLTLEIPAPRGDLVLSDGLLVATTEQRYMAIADPALVKDAPAAAAAFADIVHESVEVLQEKLTRAQDHYVILSHGLTVAEKDQVETGKYAGIFFHEEPTRWYPEKDLFAHVTGFVGFADEKMVGRYGVEEFFDAELRGIPGLIRGERDTKGQLIPTSDPEIGQGVSGARLVLTLDRSVQFFTCNALKAYIQKFSASGGTVIIQESNTGKIVALCNMPVFDPNHYGEASLASFLNPAVSLQYEPGSVFKGITMAVALDLGQVTPETTYEDTGEVRFGSHVIRNSDFKVHGVQTMTQVLEQSFNTGAVFVQRLIGKEAFARYVRGFGFGQATGITLPAELTGNVDSLDRAGEIYDATASFGQGIAVTPLQMVTAYSALANGGKLMQPYVVAEKRLGNGTVMVTTPQVVRQVLKSETSQLITAMLVSVVEKGHGKRAGVKGYYVAGKTGTAQIANAGGYDATAHIGNFVGYLPAERPRFTMITKIDRPQGVQFAESSAAPLFGQIAEFLVNYYKIPPTR